MLLAAVLLGTAGTAQALGRGVPLAAYLGLPLVVGGLVLVGMSVARRADRVVEPVVPR